MLYFWKTCVFQTFIGSCEAKIRKVSFCIYIYTLRVKSCSYGKKDTSDKAGVKKKLAIDSDRYTRVINFPKIKGGNTGNGRS